MQFIEMIGVKNLKAYGDSKLIVNQIHREHEVRYEDLVPYHNTTIDIAEKFKTFYIDHVPRQQNAHADALASLAASLTLPARATERVLIYSRDFYYCKFTLKDSKTLKGDLQVKELLETSTSLEPRDWLFSYIDFILYGILPGDPKDAAAIRRKDPRFYYNATTQTLDRRSYDGILKEALKEAHDSMCRAYQPGPKLGDRPRRLGYYWLKMIPDVIPYAKRCHAYQIHSDFVHQALGHLHPTSSS